MHVITRAALRIFCEDHPDLDDAPAALDKWYRVAKAATWKDFAELRETFSRSADKVGDFVVFNVGGNKYRLVTEIYFDDQVLLVRGVFAHREYDKLDLK